MKLSITIAAALLITSQVGATRIVSHSTLEEGSYSAISERRFEVATNMDEWASLWFEHHGYETSQPLPQVDFAVDMVLGVFMGMQPHGGNHIEVDIVIADENATGVKVRDIIRESGPRVFSSPFQFVRVNRTDAPVRFLENHRRFTVIDSGFDCLESRPSKLVIGDAETWASIWAMTFNKSMAPPVNFDRHMVLAVFMGMQPSAGHSVEIASISETEAFGSDILVPTVLNRVSAGVTLPVITRPYHFVVTAKTDLPVFFYDIEF